MRVLEEPLGRFRESTEEDVHCLVDLVVVLIHGRGIKEAVE